MKYICNVGTIPLITQIVNNAQNLSFYSEIIYFILKYIFFILK